MKLAIKIIIPIIIVLVYSFMYISYMTVQYANDTTDKVMELLDAKHINQATTFAHMIAEDPGLLDFDENGVNYKLVELVDVFGVDEIYVTDGNGILLWGSVKENLGFDFHDGEQTRELLIILENPMNIAQAPQPRGIDNVMFQYISVPRIDEPGIVQVGVSMERLEEIKSTMDNSRLIRTTGYITTGVVVLLVTLLIYIILNKPLKKLKDGVLELGTGNLDVTIDVKSKDELGLLAGTFNKMTVDLKNSIEESARERAEKERIGAELNIATQIQASMLPYIYPAYPHRDEFDIYARMQPAKEVGGDFYDFFLIDDNTLAVVMADVSGKGIPAALFMVITKTLIQNTALSGKSPEEVFRIVNTVLCESNDACMFVTAFLGYLDIRSGKFTYVNAAHNPPLIRRAGESFEMMEVLAGFVLAGHEKSLYMQHEISLNPGDEIFLYTDGVTEAANNEQELFGEERMLMAVNKHLNLPMERFVRNVRNEIDAFANGAEQADDIAMLILRSTI